MKQKGLPRGGELSYDMVPKTWALCYRADCPRAGECLRYRCYRLAPATELEHPCVLPQAWQGGDCRKFADARPQRLAWGMTRLFTGIPTWEATAIRRRLMDLFGSSPTFYRFRRGEYLISPERQQQIADIFAQHGYTAPRRYDHVVETYYFDAPGFGTLHSYDTVHTKKRLSALS